LFFPGEARKCISTRHQYILGIERLLKDRGRFFSPVDQEPLRRLLERSRALARGEHVSTIRQAMQELERARDAMARYLDGDLGAEAPPGYCPKPRFNESGFDLNLEICTIPAALNRLGWLYRFHVRQRDSA
jgi:hypothetical protein